LSIIVRTAYSKRISSSPLGASIARFIEAAISRHSFSRIADATDMVGIAGGELASADPQRILARDAKFLPMMTLIGIDGNCRLIRIGRPKGRSSICQPAGLREYHADGAGWPHAGGQAGIILLLLRGIR
jgi:hypothetical protein